MTVTVAPLTKAVTVRLRPAFEPVTPFIVPSTNGVTELGALVYDPFLGSGTTLIAAQMTERICYGLEIDPRYCDVIVRRWQELTGEQAMLDGTNKSFDEVARSQMVPERSSISGFDFASPQRRKARHGRSRAGEW